MSILEVKDLKVSFNTVMGKVEAVKGVDLSVNSGEVLGIIGESGSGKSVTSLAIMGLIDNRSGAVESGEVLFEGKNLINLTEKEMCKIRGDKISMIFQEPMTSLNPVVTIYKQLREVYKIHRPEKKNNCKEELVELLSKLNIPDPKSVLNKYPFELSGGLKQRIMIAMAMICKPSLIIADEPTTALDVTIQAQILDLMKDLKEKLDTSIILITHDLGVVADLCSRINVMYGGLIVEEGTTEDIFYRGKHPYTWGLLRSVPNPKSELKEKLIPIEGQPPDLLKPPVGCPFTARCDYAMRICKEKQPPLFEIAEGHRAACWLCHKNAPKVESPIKGEE